MLSCQDLLFFVEEPCSTRKGDHGLRELLVPTMETISEVFPVQLQQSYAWSPIQVCVQDRSQANIIIMCLLSSMTSFEPDGLNSFDLSWTLSCLTRLWNTLGSAVENSVSWYSSEQFLVMFLETLRIIMLQLVSARYETVNISRTSVLFSRIIAILLPLKPKKLTNILEKSICLSLFEIARLFQRSTAISEASDEDLLPILIKSRSRFMNFGIDLQVCAKGSLKPKPAEPFKAIYISCRTPSHSE